MKRNNLLVRFLSFAIVVVGLSGFKQPEQQQEKRNTPNVILILMDDMGY